MKTIVDSEKRKGRSCMRKISIILTKIVVPILIYTLMCGTGCIVEYDEFIHLPTDHLRQSADHRSFVKSGDFVRDGVLFVPACSCLTPSYPVPRSFVVLYCQSMKSVYLKKAVLLRKDNGCILEKAINQTVKIGEMATKDGVYQTAVLLFGREDSGIESFGDASELTLEIYYSTDGSDETLSIMFTLKKVKRRDIAWSS